MDQTLIRNKIRERLTAGTLPRGAPRVTDSGPRQSSASLGQIQADTAIDLARCSGCDDLGAAVTYRYPDGQIIRFHGRCHRLWEEECQQSN